MLSLFFIHVGAYEVLSDTALEFALGAEITIAFNFNEAMPTNMYTFIPLVHTPLQEPAFRMLDESIVEVSYDHASPSLQGEYILCGYEPENEALQCGDRLNVSVTSK